MMRKFNILYVAAVLVGLLPTAGCDRYASPSLEEVTHRQEASRLKDQEERAALAERMKAAATAEEKKREPVKVLQKQIDALEVQISEARSRGKDWRALEKTQEALEAQKYELQKQ